MALTYVGSSTPNFAGNWATYGGVSPDIDRNVSNRHSPWTVPAGGVTVFSLERGMNSAASQAGATVTIGLYDYADDSLIASATINSRFDEDPDEYVWHSVAVNISLAEGRQVYIGSGRPTMSIYHTQSADTLADVNEPSTTSLPDPWVTTSGLRREVPLRLSYDVSPYSIDSIATGGNPGLVVGQPFSITTTDMGALTSISVESVSNDDARTDAINILAATGDGTAQIEFFEDGEFMPYQGNVIVNVVGTLGTASTTVNFSIPATFLDTQFATLMMPDNTWLPYALNSIGHPLVSGEFCYYQSVNLLTISDSGKISVSQATTTDIWIHKLSGVIEGYTLQINDAGQVTGADKMSSRYISGRKITALHISKAHLQ